MNKQYIKVISGEILLKLYDNLIFDYSKSVIILDRKIWLNSYGSLEELIQYSTKLRKEGNLVFIVGIGDKFSYINNHTLLLELLRLHYFNDIEKDERFSELKELCLTNKEKIVEEGLNWRDFT